MKKRGLDFDERSGDVVKSVKYVIFTFILHLYLITRSLPGSHCVLHVHSSDLLQAHHQAPGPIRFHHVLAATKKIAPRAYYVDRTTRLLCSNCVLTNNMMRVELEKSTSTCQPVNIRKYPENRERGLGTYRG